MGNVTLQAIECLDRDKMFVIGGLIVGSPSDTAESIEANLALPSGMGIGISRRRKSSVIGVRA